MLSFFIAQSITQSVIQSSASAAQNTVSSTPIDVANNLSDALRTMGFGMLGIFCIIAVIIFLTWLLQKLFPVKKEED